MRFWFVFVTLFFWGSNTYLMRAWPVPPLSSQDLLDRARLANDQLYDDLKSFVCDEQIERYRGKLDGSSPHPIDLVSARVSFENGVEHYSEIRQDNHARAKISGLDGAWSQGEFGTLLRQTERLLAVEPAIFRGYVDLDGTRTAVYAIDVPRADSPWDLEVDGQQYQIPFHTDIWVDSDTAQILKISRTSTEVPAELCISGLHWSVVLAPTDLNGKTWLLPRTGEYAVDYGENNRSEWNLLTFSSYRRYGSEVAVTFSALQTAPPQGPK